jgi:hypothetical protein
MYVKKARFVDNDHVLVSGGSTEMAMIDVPKAQVVWSTPISILFSDEIALSHNRKQVAMLPDNGRGFALLDTMTGKLLSQFDEGWGTMTFSPDGKRIALGASDRLVIYDVATGKRLQEASVPSPGHAKQVEFIGAGDGSQLLLATNGNNYLFEPARQFVPWVYSIRRAPTYSDVALFGGRLWYLHHEGGQRVPLTTLASAVVPHKAALDAARNADVNSLMTVRPGMSVALDVRVDAPGDMVARIVDAYTKRLTKGGLKIDGAAPLKLVATTTPGKQTQIHFVNRPDLGDKTLTDLSFRVAYELNGQTLWERKGGYAVGTMANFTFVDDEQIKGLLGKDKEDALKFFESTYIPSFIQRTNGKTIGLGNTELGANGFVGDGGGGGGAQAGNPGRVGDGLE